MKDLFLRLRLAFIHATHGVNYFIPLWSNSASVVKKWTQKIESVQRCTIPINYVPKMIGPSGTTGECDGYHVTIPPYAF